MCLQLLFFFFKQKTAYEMRISDWSSDVCSSDLPTDNAAAPRRRRGCPPSQAGSSSCRRDWRGPNRCARDRKSVVSGKSVSVRVDLGGRRIIKKHTICILFHRYPRRLLEY